MNFKKLLLLACIGFLLTSCKVPKDITYMQGFDNNQTEAVAPPVRITVQPDDKLAIIVTSKDPELAVAFNLAIAQYRIGTGTNGSTMESKAAAYTIDPDGYIDFPLIGKLKVAGLNRYGVAEMIKKEIVARGLVKDPVVTVEYLNAKISVLGDVTNPGEYAIERDNMTLLQAIAMAGDLRITGNRKNILIVREESGKDVAYRVDLTDTKSLMESPAYYLRQNDVVYVEPNNTRKRQATETANVFYNPTVWVSVASVLASIAVIIFR
ncbi:MAG: polysaccharide export protein [Muribaculaceae bacterium]|nr:polysaccharide export protein [Muribaculaceae bacterium]MDE6295916.1 polysaccharide export protein [Muribaculaceae bacterium]